jgi:hypothetical protein
LTRNARVRKTLHELTYSTKTAEFIDAENRKVATRWNRKGKK